jgi:hypothetical protein
MRDPKPRQSLFYGMRASAHIEDNGTWLEPEELCYPTGGMTRKAYAMFPDGVKRLVTCGIPDTYFSIPAKPVKVDGKMVRGYIASDEKEGVVFRPYTNQEIENG